jgi:hypothetical protein
VMLDKEILCVLCPFTISDPRAACFIFFQYCDRKIHVFYIFRVREVGGGAVSSTDHENLPQIEQKSLTRPIRSRARHCDSPNSLFVFHRDAIFSRHPLIERKRRFESPYKGLEREECGLSMHFAAYSAKNTYFSSEWYRMRQYILFMSFLEGLSVF